jgi:release factor glutamine methyltransferase
VGRAVSIHERVAAARRQLREAGIRPDEADLDTRLLARHALGWDAARFLTSAADAEPPGFAETYAHLVARRERREPTAYILGERDFWNRTFAVSPAVLVPRPETELIVEAALEWLNDRRGELQARGDGARIADVGTGSGCLAVTLACEVPSARIVATDVSEEALTVARGNARRHDVSSRVRFKRADLLGPDSEPFDVIVSNPPYVRDRDRVTLQPEVRDFEPGAALFSGPDGLDVIRRLVRLAPEHLAAEGALIMEVGAGQADDVSRLISAAGTLTMSEVRHDLQGIPRTIIAHRI